MSLQKKICGFFIALVISLSMINVTPIYANSQINLTINYVPITSGAKPIITKGSTLVPIRIISETLGANVQWNPKTKQVSISNPDTTINMTIGNPKVKVNDLLQTIPAAPVIHKGSTMLPIRFVGEALDATVNWDSQTRTVSVLGRDLAQAPKPDFTVDPWGRKVRTSNLPKNAGIFPYMVEDVPNWVYEKINMTSPSLTSGSGIGKFPKELFSSQYDYQPAIDLLESHFERVLNVNHKTIDQIDFKNYVQSAFNDQSFASTGFSNMEWAGAFVDHVISNKIISKGSAKILPEMFWTNSLGETIVHAWVELQVLQQGPKGQGGFQDFGGFPSNESLTGIYPHLVTNKKYQGLVQFRLIDNEIDYNTNSIGSQIHPEPNGFGGAYTGK